MKLKNNMVKKKKRKEIRTNKGDDKNEKIS